MQAHLLSSLATVTHPQFLLVSKGLPLLSGSHHSSFYPADSVVNGQPQHGGRNLCLNSILAADPKTCYPSLFLAAPSSPLAGRRAASSGRICAAKKWRPFRRRKTRPEAKKFLNLVVYLHTAWPLLLVQEGLKAALSLGLLGSENESLGRFMLDLIAGGGRRRKRRGFRGYLALALLATFVACIFLLLLSQGNAADLSSVLSPIVTRKLREVASMFSFAFRRRGAW